MTIVLTLPYFVDGEAERIASMLSSASVDLVHIRKPEATAAELEQLIMAIPSSCRSQLVLHDHYELAVKYNLFGVHLNSRNPQPPAGWRGSVSRSCHSIEEVKQWKPRCRYVSLSPIFNSISKQGYKAAFSREQLEKAHAEGIIDHKVMALGGVTFGKIDDVLRMGFGGGMILGDAWKTTDEHLTPVALTIAGSDSSAGAGLQQDLKTMTALGVYAATVVTAITSQNTMGVARSDAMTGECVGNQLDAVLSDLRIEAIKIGMLPNSEVVVAIASRLKEYKLKHKCQIVYDPVMVSSSGRPLMENDCMDAVIKHLLPICTLVTPNIPEADYLIEKAGLPEGSYHSLPETYATAFLVKGGHANDQTANDILLPCPYDATKVHQFESHFIATHNLHGTGCTLSSAIAAYLLNGYNLEKSVGMAKEFINKSILRGKEYNIGHGNGPLITFGS